LNSYLATKSEFCVRLISLQIMDLATAGWIESRAVEDDRMLTFARKRFNHASVKVIQQGVVV